MSPECLHNVPYTLLLMRDVNIYTSTMSKHSSVTENAHEYILSAIKTNKHQNIIRRSQVWSLMMAQLFLARSPREQPALWVGKVIIPLPHH